MDKNIIDAIHSVFQCRGEKLITCTHQVEGRVREREEERCTRGEFMFGNVCLCMWGVTLSMGGGRRERERR